VWKYNLIGSIWDKKTEGGIKQQISTVKDVVNAKLCFDESDFHGKDAVAKRFCTVLV
jgi:hypothetical protein